jgi:hypothetical protein
MKSYMQHSDRCCLRDPRIMAQETDMFGARLSTRLQTIETTSMEKYVQYREKTNTLNYFWILIRVLKHSDKPIRTWGANRAVLGNVPRCICVVRRCICAQFVQASYTLSVTVACYDLYKPSSVASKKKTLNHALRRIYRLGTSP